MYVGFTDRIEAAKRLAAALAHYRGKNPLVMAIPAGMLTNSRPVDTVTLTGCGDVAPTVTFINK